MATILNHKATWFVAGAVLMYFAYPWVRGMIPGGQQS